MSVETEVMKKTCVEHTKQISSNSESLKSAHKRIDKIEETQDVTQRLVVSVENLTKGVCVLGDKIEHGLREQGQRIGAQETITIGLANEVVKISEMDGRIRILEARPGDEALKKQTQNSHAVRNAIISSIISLLIGAGIPSIIFLLYYINS